MSRDFGLYLEDIQQSCEKIIRYAQNLTKEQFWEDEKCVDAVVRNLAIIGEAVKRIPFEIIEKYSEIDWNKIAGLRNILIHEYFGIDEDIIWDIVREKIPLLSTQIKTIITKEEG